MNPFRYERAADAQAAVAALAAAPNGAFLGGGTNLVDHMRLGVRQPDLLIDITHLPYDRIEPLPDGPLQVRGNLEITSGTGRVVARVQSARLCRCGGSGNKPFCDGSHARIGFRSE